MIAMVVVLCSYFLAYTVGGLKNGGSKMTVDERFEQLERKTQRLEKRNKRLTVGLTMMAMVAVTIQLSACGDDPAGPSTNCDVSDVGALAGRDLSECDLVNANLEGADLRDAKLVNANLRYANLKSANLSGANLRYANLKSANLSGANLEDANLRDANLVDASLSGANLEGANLEDASLSGANLEDANLEGSLNLPVLQYRQIEDACWSDCG
jgi:hypothetical protein